MQRGDEWRTWAKNLARTLADGALLLMPGVLGLGLIFVVAKPISGASAPDEGSAAVPPLCSGWHRGDGESRAFDLARTERGYKEFKEALSQSLSKSLKDQKALVSPTGYDAGLAACTRGTARRVTPAKALPDSLRGRRLWFIAAVGGKAPRVPKEVEADPDAILLVAKIDKPDDLSKVSRTIGRPASLAPRGLGEALGVRCVPALVTISKEGEVEIHEDP